MLVSQTEKARVNKKFLKEAKIAIIRSEFNGELTKSLEEYCLKTLFGAGLAKKQIFLYRVPGAFEIPVCAKVVAQKRKPDVIIALGVIIKGDTYHFEVIASECARGCMDVSLKFNIPIIFEVIATYNLVQAKKRASDNSFNKGIEAANAALNMIDVVSKI